MGRPTKPFEALNEIIIDHTRAMRGRSYYAPTYSARISLALKCLSEGNRAEAVQQITWCIPPEWTPNYPSFQIWYTGDSYNTTYGPEYNLLWRVLWDCLLLPDYVNDILCFVRASFRPER